MKEMKERERKGKQRKAQKEIVNGREEITSQDKLLMRECVENKWKEN